jgi:phosphopantetheinyl transferase (holo-ACP synthase)
MLKEMMTYPCGSRVLLWRLDEEASQLLALCCEECIPVDDLTGLPVKRLREKAAERLLLCRAFGHPVALSHTRQGAPYVEGSHVNISISHTMQLVALAWNEQAVIGLDVEQLDRKQVIRVRDKFLNASEQQFISPDDQTAHVIAWTAKEAIIKAERNSALDWTDGICLQPFTPADHETTLHACCADHLYRLTARLVEGHCITLALPAVD